MPDPDIQIIVLLGLAAFAAGFVDSIAGGGGLITMPALLLAGFPPVAALGTNKLQGLFGTGFGDNPLCRQGPCRPEAAIAVGRAGLRRRHRRRACSRPSFPAASCRAALPFILVAIALYFALKPGMDDIDRAERLSPFLFGLTIVPLIGFYDGVFGPGTGSFFMLAFVSLAGYGVLKATAHTKLLNFASNLGGFVLFAFAGAIYWKIGLLMGVAQFLGARLGAGLAIANGARLIKPLLVVVCLALAARLLIDPAHPLRLFLGF